MRPGFITFEGVDGCGKSTQLKLAADWLVSAGMRVRTAFEPGDHSLGEGMRTLLLSGEYTPVPEAELLLFLADRAQHVREVICPSLREGYWVLCDRYTDSTLAYQMAGRKLDAAAMKGLLCFAEMGMQPSFTLWLDLPVHDALERTRYRSHDGEDTTRIDEESLSFHMRVREGFKQIYRQEPGRMCRIDACGSVDKVQQRIRQAMRDHFVQLP